MKGGKSGWGQFVDVKGFYIDRLMLLFVSLPSILDSKMHQTKSPISR